MTRDARGRYSDDEVAAIERAFGLAAADQDALDAMADTFLGQRAVIHCRERAVVRELEASLRRSRLGRLLLRLAGVRS